MDAASWPWSEFYQYSQEMEWLRKRSSLCIVQCENELIVTRFTCTAGVTPPKNAESHWQYSQEMNWLLMRSPLWSVHCEKELMVTRLACTASVTQRKNGEFSPHKSVSLTDWSPDISMFVCLQTVRTNLCCCCCPYFSCSLHQQRRVKLLDMFA